MYMCMYVCVYIYIYVCVCMYICIYITFGCHNEMSLSINMHVLNKYFSFFQTFNSTHVYTYNSIHIQIMQKNTRTSRAAVDPQHLKVEIPE